MEQLDTFDTDDQTLSPVDYDSSEEWDTLVDPETISGELQRQKQELALLDYEATERASMFGGGWYPFVDELVDANAP